MFGTRADAIVDGVLMINVLAPFIATFAARLARRGQHRQHMWVQLTLWAVLAVNVVVLEVHIRLSGGSGSLVGDSPYAGTTLLRGVFAAHILPAVATYLLWGGLVWTTFVRRNQPQLGGRASLHRTVGKVVIAGLVWTALSAGAVYYFGFAA
ncbi:MAG: hypothetical protein KTR31_08900 [Myxococcales bacterium]|nr:hypothetical protein [Myxococcales bacterium]